MSEELVEIKFRRSYTTVIKGKEIRFKEDQITNLERSVALKLFQAGVVYPGKQFTQGGRIGG